MRIFLSVIAMMILFTGSVEAADLNVDSGKVFIARRYFLPPRLRRPFLPTVNTPKKEYPSRVPARPKPHYTPHVPKTTYDDRGGKRKNFGPPRAPRR